MTADAPGAPAGDEPGPRGVLEIVQPAASPPDIETAMRRP